SKPCQEVAQSEDGSPTSSAPRWRSSRGTLRVFWAASMRATRRTCPPLKETRVRSTLIDDLRTLALAGSGTLALHRESVDVGALLQDLVAAFGARAEAAGVALTTECPADLTTVEVDSVRIRQVIANLLTNALQHSGAGGHIRVRCQWRAERAE